MARRAERPAREVGRTGEGRLKLLGDERVREWFEDVARGGRNRLAATTNVQKLDFLLESLGLSLDETERLATGDPKGLRRRLTEFNNRMTEQQKTSSYVRRLFASLRAYLRFREVAFALYPRLESIEGTSIANEKVPSREQLGEILDRLSLRGKVTALLMAHSGLRPQAIGAYEGARGLVLSDIPELELGPAPRVTKLPFVIRGRAELGKKRKSWVTFGSPQLATSLVAYLKERQNRGERLLPSSPVVTRGETRGIAARKVDDARGRGGFLTTFRVVFELGRVLHASAPKGTRWRPYVLRSYFSTGLLRAGVDLALREAMLAHDLGVQGAYSVGKPWSDDLIEKARSEMGRAYDVALSTVPGAAETEDLRREFRMMLLAREGFSATEADELARLPAKEILARLSERRAGVPVPAGSIRGVSRGSQRIVSVTEAEHLLADGRWEVFAPAGDRLVVRAVQDSAGPPGAGAPS